MKICKANVLKDMIMRLQKIEYGTSKYSMELFYKQYYEIYTLLWRDYYSKNIMFKNLSTFFIIQLLTFIGGEDCILKRTQAYLQFNEHDYFFTIQWWHLHAKLSKCTDKKVLVPFIIQFTPTDAHANLLVVDAKLKKVYRIEPNYGFETKYDTVITNRLEYFASNLGFVYSGFFPSSCQKLWHPGLCLMLSVLKYKFETLTNDQIKSIIVSFFKSEYNRICSKNLKD